MDAKIAYSSMYVYTILRQLIDEEELPEALEDVEGVAADARQVVEDAAEPGGLGGPKGNGGDDQDDGKEKHQGVHEE